MKSKADLMREMRKRRALEGLVRIETWVPVGKREIVEKAIARALQQKAPH